MNRVIRILHKMTADPALVTESLLLYTSCIIRISLVHGFTRDSYEVVEGETITVTLDINLKGRTAFPFLQINGVITSDNTTGKLL